jgi:mono/diheme cytochrome c family protein
LRFVLTPFSLLKKLGILILNLTENHVDCSMHTFLRKTLFTALFVTFIAGPPVAIADSIDLYKLGKIVNTTGSESCLTCHGSDGNGTSRSNVSLRQPQTWKAFQLESALRGSDVAIESEAVVKAVISLGAKGWNEKNFGKLRTHLSKSVEEETPPQRSVPFDEDMIGLEGPNKKVLSKRVIRMMRAAGMPRPRPEEINDVLAAAAFTYINQEFVDDEDH